MKKLIAAFLSVLVWSGLSVAEWKEISNFQTILYEHEVLQCDLRLKHLAAASGGMVITNTYPLTRREQYKIGSNPYTTLTFEMQPETFLSMLNAGGQKAVSAGFLDAIRNTLLGGIPYFSGVKIEFSRNWRPEPMASVSVRKQSGPNDSAGWAMNTNVIRLEANCTNTQFPGDANHDACVDYKDYYVWVSNMLIRNQAKVNTYGATFEQGDFDGNGILDYADMNIISNNYSKGCNIFGVIAPQI